MRARPGGVLWDLFCGTGALGLAVAREHDVRLYGAEVDAGALELAVRAAERAGVDARYEPADLRSEPPAWPAPEGIYVSTLIHGAIGLFDWNGGYRELLRGYWGCHGVRKIDDATLLLTDSCLGCACLLDIDSTRLLGRIDFGSRWLHDTETPDGRHFFGALADHNRLALFDRDEGVIVAEWPMERFGQGLQFMSALPLGESGLPWLDDAACAETLLAR